MLERFDGANAGDGTCHHGEVHVVRRVSGYKKIRFYSHENIGYGPVNLPDQELHTSALWWQLEPERRSMPRSPAGRRRSMAFSARRMRCTRSPRCA